MARLTIAGSHTTGFPPRRTPGRNMPGPSSHDSAMSARVSAGAAEVWVRTRAEFARFRKVGPGECGRGRGLGTHRV